MKVTRNTNTNSSLNIHIVTSVLAAQLPLFHIIQFWTFFSVLKVYSKYTPRLYKETIPLL